MMNTEAIAEAFDTGEMIREERINGRKVQAIVIFAYVSLFIETVTPFYFRGQVTAAIIFGLGSLVSLRLPHNEKAGVKVRNTLSFIVLGLAALGALGSKFGTHDYTFRKDFATPPVIIREQALLFSSSRRYFRAYGPFMYEIEEYDETNDGFNPFYYDAYSVEWEGSTAVIHYSYNDWDKKSPEKWVRICIGL